MITLNFRPYRRKIGKFSCKFPSIRTENNIYRWIYTKCSIGRRIGKCCSTRIKVKSCILVLITRTFLCKDKELTLQLYKSLVRPRLEYCIQAWRPYLKKDINVLERVQKKSHKISGLSEMGYKD